ncbi:MAG: (Fe-S)-binding protein [Peptococcaceae bacterium]
MHKIVEPYYDEAYNCIRCGVCQSVCPVYAVEKHEGTVARGKIRLVRELVEGKVELTPRLRSFMDLCLGCGACTENCPPKVRGDKIVTAARAQFVKDQGLPFVFNIGLRWVLKNPALTQGVFSSLGIARSTAVNKLLPKSLKELEDIIPPLPKETFWQLYKKRQPLKSEKKVGYFVGCMTNLVFPQVGLAVLDVLERHGYEVVVPQAYCCGIPHYISGDVDTARALAEKNMKVFLESGVGTILTDCGSCGGTLKEYTEWLDREDARAFSKKIRDISEFLVNEVKVEPGTQEVAGTVTYHDSCHLNRSMGVKTEPRELLKAIKGLKFVELPEADRCCGGAGTFNFKKYDVSMKILKRKMANAESTEAEALAVGCPGCRIQLSHGIRKYSHNLKNVVHPVELLARSYEV